ncbi:hypothetical protein ACQEV4_18260 [Streptomyces shenzhenensis]
MTDPTTPASTHRTATRASRLPHSLTSDPDQRVTVSIISGLAAWP